MLRIDLKTASLAVLRAAALSVAREIDQADDLRTSNPGIALRLDEEQAERRDLLEQIMRQVPLAKHARAILETEIA